MSAPTLRLSWVIKTACWSAPRPRAPPLRARKLARDKGRPSAPSSESASTGKPLNRALKSLAQTCGLTNPGSIKRWVALASRAFVARVLLKPSPKCSSRVLSPKTGWSTVHLQIRVHASSPRVEPGLTHCIPPVPMDNPIYR